jgi:hypothetical protein
MSNVQKGGVYDDSQMVIWLSVTEKYGRWGSVVRDGKHGLI